MGPQLTSRRYAAYEKGVEVFVAGSTGAVGKFLVPQLVENGHEVVALVRHEY